VADPYSFGKTVSLLSVQIQLGHAQVQHAMAKEALSP